MASKVSQKIVPTLVCCVLVLSVIATAAGILWKEGGGTYTYASIRGHTVTIWGKGLYKQMSAEVAPQGIAQDYITLFIAVPFLIVSLILARKGIVKAKILLAGALLYFFVTYLFYTVMGMYNEFFLLYVALMGTSFFSFLLTITSFEIKSLPQLLRQNLPVKLTGGFLMFNTAVIAILWLKVVVPPLLDGSIIPLQVEHYTTLVVQGLDLGILLPAGFFSGYLFYRKIPFGFLAAPVYFIFLSLLMTALTAKVAAMNWLGMAVGPALYIIPVFNLAAIAGTWLILRERNENGRQRSPLSRLTTHSPIR